MKRLSLVFAALMMTATVIANTLTETQALGIAQAFANRQFSNPPTFQQHAAPRRAKASDAAQPAYYVFNAEQSQGYVIVAADDQAPAILGYADSGTFDAAAMPPAMQRMLEGYEAQIALIASGEAQPAQKASYNRRIAPMLKSHWNQSAPYNALLPTVEGSTAYTGCVATAMAQVMFYHKWPPRPTNAIPAYTTATKKINMPQLDPVDFKWDIMKDFNINDGSEASNAVATLMLYCAQSLEMDFKKGASSASTSTMISALNNYFDYDINANYVERANYTQQTWETMIINELLAHRPIPYRGDKDPGGHAFVCDGYDGNGMFHFNWGWASSSDGYFLLSVLNPSDQGIGSANGPYGYIFDQAMIIGIQPNTGAPVNDPMLKVSNLTLDSPTTITRASIDENLTVTITNRFSNAGNTTANFQCGWAAFKNGSMIECFQGTPYSSLRPRYGSNRTVTMNMRGSNYGNGTYRLMPVYRITGNTEWKLCAGAETNYIDMTITGNTAILTGRGAFGTAAYTVNNFTFSGTMNQGKPVSVVANLTNNGTVDYSMIYVFVDNVRTSAAVAEIPAGQSGDIRFNFTPSTTGTKQIKLALDENGTNVFYTTSVTINQMPSANLTVSTKVLNVTNGEIRAKVFPLQVTVTNNSSSATYNEDIAVKFYRITSGNSGTEVQTMSQTVSIGPRATKTINFELDNVVVGQKYFAWVYYFSQGNEVKAKGTSAYLFAGIDEPEVKPGDADENGIVDIQDMNIVINIILGVNGYTMSKYPNADVDGNGIVDIQDMNLVINAILAK